MPNMTDYLKWRGDISFSQVPFNDVDNIVLAYLAYTDFANVVPGPGIDERISLADAYDKFFSMNSREEIMSHKSSVKVAPFLMDDMVHSERYKDIFLTGYVDEVVVEEDSQFSVTTFILPDSTYYVAFRGTDSTIVGWKEDLNMGYLYQTLGQKKAMEYLNTNFSDIDCSIRVGGHSKGGNFAVYASAFCDYKIQDKIVNVYTNDGPGFRKDITLMSGYNRILPKIRSIVPENSVVGMLLLNNLEHKIVKSSNFGIQQHDAMSWQVLGGDFITCENLSERSIMIDEAVSNWIIGLNDEERKIFIDSLFQPLSDANIDTVDDLSEVSRDNLHRLREALSGLSEEQHSALKDTAGKLISSAIDTLKSKK